MKYSVLLIAGAVSVVRPPYSCTIGAVPGRFLNRRLFIILSLAAILAIGFAVGAVPSVRADDTNLDTGTDSTKQPVLERATPSAAALGGPLRPTAILVDSFPDYSGNLHPNGIAFDGTYYWVVGGGGPFGAVAQLNADFYLVTTQTVDLDCRSVFFNSSDGQVYIKAYTGNSLYRLHTTPFDGSFDTVYTGIFQNRQTDVCSSPGAKYMYDQLNGTVLEYAFVTGNVTNEFSLALQYDPVFPQGYLLAHSGSYLLTLANEKVYAYRPDNGALMGSSSLPGVDLWEWSMSYTNGLFFATNVAESWWYAFLIDDGSQQSSLTLERVEGLYEAGILPINETVTFYIRMTNGTGDNVRGITNGFRVYSPDGAEWTTTRGDTLGSLDWGYNFGLAFFVSTLSVNGAGADTVGFGGSGTGIGQSIGLPAGFDNAAYAVTIGPIDPEHDGRTICLDSSFYSPSGVWKWQIPRVDPVFPTWDGPHCYTVVDESSCCQVRGDVNHDGTDIIDISDLMYLIYYMFREGPPPVCMAEADVNGDNPLVPDIGDLVTLINHMFDFGPPLVPCYSEPHSIVGEYNGTYSVTSDYGLPSEQVLFNWVNFAFFEETYLIEIDVENNTGVCFCRADGLYAVAEGVRFQEQHSQPYASAGCEACDSDDNPVGTFIRQYASDTLVLKQMMGTTLKELRLVRTSAGVSSR